MLTDSRLLSLYLCDLRSQLEQQLRRLANVERVVGTWAGARGSMVRCRLGASEWQKLTDDLKLLSSLSLTIAESAEDARVEVEQLLRADAAESTLST